MITKEIRRKIESLAWDCTIGAGELERDRPTQKSYLTLAVALGETQLTDGERHLFESAWRQCIQDAANP